ncbi:MAG TPA: hypothetical protein VMU26_16615 [Candidatus Polarisedimenticolia bacterium]|nr:hypothetical protein [Candidatus Polarisedimenticolia bacterium]
MLESILELLFGLVLSTLIVLIGSCIPVSIVAALRAVGRGSDCEREEVTVVDDRMIDAGVIVMTNPENHYGL